MEEKLRTCSVVMTVIRLKKYKKTFTQSLWKLKARKVCKILSIDMFQAN